MLVGVERSFRLDGIRPSYDVALAAQSLDNPYFS